VLSDASALFAESFDREAIAAALVELVVPRLGRAVACCTCSTSRSSSCSPPVRPGDDDVTEAAVRFFGAAPILQGVPYGPAAVLATGQPQLLPTPTPQSLRAVTANEKQARALGRILRDSNLCLPLTARGRTFGVLTLSRDARYTEGDVEHALDLARRAALAVDNASRYAFERDLAVTLQRSLLPRALGVREGMTAAARYLPGARGTQVGGDWYDLLEVDGKVVLVVGDVMGRGVQAPR
jgi:GAF domain-containing protein